MTALLLAGAGWPAHDSVAATIVVDSTADDMNQGPNGDCTLREAIFAANSDFGVDGCTAGAGADTIVLPAGTYRLTIEGRFDDGDFTGDLDVWGDTVIQGNGAASTIVDAGGIDGVFEVFESSTTTLADLTIQGGDAPFSWDPTIGYGVLSVGADLTLERCVVRGNGHEGIYELWTESGPKKLTLSHTKVVENSGVLFAVFVEGGTARLVGSEISRNTFLGGAVYSLGADDVTIEGCTIADNTSTDLPGPMFASTAVGNEYGHMTLDHSTVTRNRCRIGTVFNLGSLEVRASAIEENGNTGVLSEGYAQSLVVTDSLVRGNGCAECRAGGIYTDFAGLDLERSTISDNVGVTGGGIYADGPTGRIADSTISGNLATTGGGLWLATGIEVINTTISENRATTGGGVFVGGYGTEAALTHTTIANNTASGKGSALFVGTQALPAHLTLTNSVLKGACARVKGSTLSSGGGNVEGPGHTCSLEPRLDRVNQRSLGLDPLARNGGPTSTRALRPGSPAIDWSVAAACPATDQRGEPRPVDGNGDARARCDAGAYEYHPE